MAYNTTPHHLPRVLSLSKDKVVWPDSLPTLRTVFTRKSVEASCALDLGIFSLVWSLLVGSKLILSSYTESVLTLMITGE